MKITKFIATKVYNYINIEINFNHDLSIITGINGSGKTTAITLMHALLCPNFKDIFSIPFHSVELHLVLDKKSDTIKVNKEGSSYVFIVNSIREKLKISDFNPAEIEFLKMKGREVNSDINEIIFSKYNTHPVIKFIKLLPSPTFLGLDRKNEILTDGEDAYAFERRHFLTSHRNRELYEKYKRQYKGTLSSSLVETELLVQQTYGRLKRIEDRLNAVLKDEILLSSFEYTSFNENFNINGFQEKRKLLSRRMEIKNSLIKIGYGENPKFVTKLDDFFSKLERLLDNLENKKGEIDIEWLINHAQIDKLSRIVEVIDDYNSKVSIGFKPLDKYLKIVNSFFNDSEKLIEINKVGQLSIKTPNKEDVKIDALSSGEMQLIILFANVMLSRFKGEKEQKVLIIDEPELSLHIRWQERFIDSLKKASESTQFILATHSPDIIGDYKNKCVKIRNESYD